MSIIRKGERMSKSKAKISRNLALSLLFTGTTATAVSFIPQAAYAGITGIVQGVVRGENGQPLPNAAVYLVGAGTPPHTRTDKNGFYLFTGVQPGAYTLRVQLVTYEPTELPVQIVQDVTSNIDFALNKAILRRSGTGFISRIRNSDPATITVITKLEEQREKSQPNSLYQSTGLLNYKPGVTTDAGQYPHLRGASQNQIDYLVDGLSIRDPVFNEFQTNLVTVGIQTSNVATAGQDASYGGATGGYLNQITSNGRDLKGGVIETTFGPAHLWRYSGNRFEYGNITPDRKFDYAVSNINYKTFFGPNTQIGELHSSTDSQVKLNYYGDGGNTFTLYGEHGGEDYHTYDSNNPNFNSALGAANGETYKFGFGQLTTGTNPKTGQPVTFAQGANTNQYQLDHSVQTNNNVYAQLKHAFTTSSYVTGLLFDQHQHSPSHLENTNTRFYDSYNTKRGAKIDYYNDLNRNVVLRAGYLRIDTAGTFYRPILGFDPQFLPLTDKNASRTYYSDRAYTTTPLENDLYLSSTYKTTDGRLVVDLGARYGNAQYRNKVNGQTVALYSAIPGQTPPPDKYTTHYLDPRFGLVYSPDRSTAFRTSYAVNSQFPETRYISFTSPIENGFTGTALDPVAQFTYIHTSRSGFNRLGPAHSNDFDLGVERAFNLPGVLRGAYATSLTGYKKKQYDLIELDQPTFDQADFPGTILFNGATVKSNRFDYFSGGHSHASGAEFSLRKVQVHPSDWSGYVNYTNQVVRANVDFFDTAYVPYFYNSLKGNAAFYDGRTVQQLGAAMGNPNNLPASQDFRRLNQLEFPTSYDQRHTIAAVLNKSFFKYVDSTFVLDAGSGFPFFTGAAATDGGFGPADSFHGELGTSLGSTGKADFTEVPLVNGFGGGQHANPNGVIAGHSGWHYKFNLNTTFHLTSMTSVFLNVDNIFDKKTILNYAPSTLSGQPYFVAPTAAFPQGRIIYGAQAIITPIFLTFGFQQKF